MRYSLPLGNPFKINFLTVCKTTEIKVRSWDHHNPPPYLLLNEYHPSGQTFDYGIRYTFYYSGITLPVSLLHHPLTTPPTVHIDTLEISPVSHPEILYL